MSATPPAASAPETPQQEQVRLALERTWLAAERTLMAWIRTALSLITFGFGLYRFLVYIRAQEPDAPPARLLGERAFGLILIGIGLVSLVLATIQHRRVIRSLKTEWGAEPYSLSLIAAALIGALGVLAFVDALVRH